MVEKLNCKLTNSPFILTLAAELLSPVNELLLFDRPMPSKGRFSEKSSKECVLFDAIFLVNYWSSKVISSRDLQEQCTFYSQLMLSRYLRKVTNLSRQQKRPKNIILEPAMYLGNVLPMLLPFLFIQFLKLLTSIYSMNKFSPQRSSNRRGGISLDFWSLSKGKLFFRSFSTTEENSLITPLPVVTPWSAPYVSEATCELVPVLR